MDPHRVPNRVGLDLVHNKDLHPADLDLEAPSSSKDQREVHRREHNLVHEGVHRRNLSREALVDPEDRGLNNPHKDLWVAPSHLLPQEALAGHLPEVRGGLETTKRNVPLIMGGPLPETLMCRNKRETQQPQDRRMQIVYVIVIPAQSEAA